MNKHVMNHTGYYRDSLADEATLLSAGEGNASKTVLLQAGMFDSGHIPTELIQHFFKKNKYDDGESITLVQCVASPVRLKLKRRHGQVFHGYPSTVTPVLIPCQVNSAGRIFPVEEKLPWIPRDYLDPLAEDKMIILSSVDAVDRYQTENGWTSALAGWPQYLAYCRELIGALLDIPLSGEVTFGEAEYVVEWHTQLYSSVGQLTSTMHIKALYEDLLERETSSKLYETILGLHPVERDLLSLSQEIDVSAEFHVGQMTPEYGLGCSQRGAIHHFFSVNDGEVLAVNGPPGTGKTTLLQSAIASLWVKSVLDAEKEDADPPIIVATSANNQAVTNIIRDFGEILSQNCSDPLVTRWLPEEVSSLGSYAVSGSKEINPHANFLTVFRKGKLQGYFNEFEEPEFIARAYDGFVENYEAYSGETVETKTELQRVKSLRRIRNNLRSDIVQFHENGKELLALWQQCADDVEEKAQTESGLAEIEARASFLREEIAAKKQAVERASNILEKQKRNLELAALQLAREPWWEDYISFLRPIKKRKSARAKAFLLRNEIDYTGHVFDDLQSIETFLEDQKLVAANEHDEAKGCLAASETALCGLEETKNLLEQTIRRIDKRREKLEGFLKPAGINAEFSRAGLYRLLEHLDKKNRFRMFILAVHYYEALWLEEVLQSDCKKFIPDNVRWKRIAKLTPCIVSTLFMLPKFFKSFDDYQYELIDLLIIDEAGQAAPDKAAAVFSLAKKALVVGDIYQIEPVYQIPPSVDLGNMRKHQLYSGGKNGMPYEKSASKGSIMMMAQAACPYHCQVGEQKASERGMYLLEHRRCHESIISFCKDLAYPQLEVHTSPSTFQLFPPMAFAHIPSKGSKGSGSWMNEYEAKNIVQWLCNNRDEILSHYNSSESLADVVSIITPFKAQERTIRSYLKNMLPKDVSGMTVGTVHRLQGAERPIVIFSPVYGPEDVRVPFFDRGVNMLNVAASRAKHSFIVFGNMGLFRKGKGAPSQILANHLFADEGNALPGFELAPRDLVADQVEHLRTLERHREVLASALNEAREEVIIVSPFLSGNAIQSDNIVDYFRSAVGRGVEVKVFSDAFLALKACDNQKAILESISYTIRESGAQLVFADGIHNKTLIVDNRILVEGSFNWLSASRDTYISRVEHSILYVNTEAESVRNDALKTLKKIISKRQFDKRT
jgi:hypothetical protein